MILTNNFSQKTHYEIIGVKEDASLEEIRQKYRSSILSYHPDKTYKTSELNDSNSRFLEVQSSWKVLSDPTSRALYDNQLQNLRQDCLFAEDVSLKDMTVEEDDENCFQFSYPCRCGDYFSVDSSELEEMGCTFFRTGTCISIQNPASIILSCGSCSLKLLLSIDAV